MLWFNRIFIAAALLFQCHVAMALEQSSTPTKFPIWWGYAAGSNFIRNIPVPSQIGIQNCAASLTDGFPALTFTPVGSGGCPPFGADFNGILRQITQWSQWQAAGNPVIYDSAFSSSIGGYPKGATLVSASVPGCFWVSTVDNNASDPDTGGSNWVNTCTYILSQPNIWTVPQTFGNGNFRLAGSSSGYTTLVAEPVGGGTVFVPSVNDTVAVLNTADQQVSGGANVTSLSLGTVSSGTLTIDCGARPLQFLTNGGNFTLAAPTHDGSCIVQVINNSNAGTITFSQFRVNPNYVGGLLNTGNGNRFMISITVIDASAIYTIIPQQ